MDLDALFGGSGNSGTDVDVVETVEADAEIEETDESEETDLDEVDAEVGDGLGWRTLVLLFCGGSVLLALVIALMWWVIGGVVDGN